MDMMVYGLLSACFIFSFITLYILWRSVCKPLRNSWHSILAAIAIGAFIYLYGPWIYLSIYCKYLFGALFLLVLLSGIFREKERAVYRSAAGLVVFHLFLFVLFGAASILYFTGTTGRPDKVALKFPLKKGRYFVLQGGKGLPANFFHYSYRGAVYAIDLVKLDKYGRRANHIFSGRLNDYYIFNDTIFSPCSGLITNVRNENPDNTPPSRKRGPSNLNTVVIETGSVYVFLGHMKQGSVMVQEGQRVVHGQPLALVGNSGFSLEPHLHIQAHKKTGGQPWYRGDPLYIEFDGETYLLFETIRPRKVDMVER